MLLNQENLQNVVFNLIESKNPRIERQVNLTIRNMMLSKPVSNKPTGRRLQIKSYKSIKDNLYIDLTIQLLNYRLEQFVCWFKYMMGCSHNPPTLCLKTYNRIKKNYPYTTHGILRVVRVRIPE